MTVDEKHKAEVGLPQRLLWIRKGQNFTQKEMADKYWLPLEAYQRYEDGDRLPDSNFLMWLALDGFSATWLLTGRGEIRPCKESEEA